jgi:hypothetical protein
MDKTPPICSIDLLGAFLGAMVLSFIIGYNQKAEIKKEQTNENRIQIVFWEVWIR